MNYDFKLNWTDIILPLLLHPSVKKSIKKGISNFIKEGYSYEDKYDRSKCPASYCSNDGWVTYIENFKEQLSTKLIDTGFMKKSPDFEDKDDDFDINECPEYIEYEKYKEAILEPFVKHHEKTSLRAYQIFGACHWWNPTFGLTLAKLVYPNESWKVLEGEYHTTIVNKDNTLVFDILYFDENNATKGGNKALEAAYRTK